MATEKSCEITTGSYASTKMRHCFRITTMFQNSDISTFPNRASNQRKRIHKFSDFKFVFAGTEFDSEGTVFYFTCISSLILNSFYL